MSIPDSIKECIDKSKDYMLNKNVIIIKLGLEEFNKYKNSISDYLSGLDAETRENNDYKLYIAQRNIHWEYIDNNIRLLIKENKPISFPIKVKN
jgi:hypothetical protein